MSDRDERQCSACGGRGFHEPECRHHRVNKDPAPLSPIALDWRGMVRMAEGLLPDGSADPGALRPGVLDREYLRELVETWHRTEVARVAQEEREKYEGRIKELEEVLAASKTLLAVKNAGCKCHYRYINLPVA